MSFIDGILEDLKQGAIEAAKQVAINQFKEAAKDAVEFVESALPSIGRYINLLISKQISPEEFKNLMLGLKDLAQMNGLTAAGLAAIQVDNTRNAILQAVTSVAIGAVGKIG